MKNYFHAVKINNHVVIFFFHVVILNSHVVILIKESRFSQKYSPDGR